MIHKATLFSHKLVIQNFTENYKKRLSILVNDNKLQFLFYNDMRDWDNETAALVDSDLSLENEVIVDTSSKEVLVNYLLDGSYLSHHILSDKSNFYDTVENQSQSAFMSKPTKIITIIYTSLPVIAILLKMLINLMILIILDYLLVNNMIPTIICFGKNIGTSYGYFTNAAVHKSGKLVLNFSLYTKCRFNKFRIQFIF